MVGTKHSGGAANGPQRVPFDRWFRYPAGYSPHALEVAMGAACLQAGDLLVDPFAGAATGWRAGAARGYRYAGLEAHPEIAELAQIKLAHIARPQQIVEQAERLVRNIVAVDISEETDLVRRSFERGSLQKLVSLRNQLKPRSRQVTGAYLKWCLLGALRDCATVQVRWPYQRPSVERQPRIADPVHAFLRRAKWMASDLHAATSRVKSTVLQGDARSSEDWARMLAGESANAIVTSPPYLNNFDYADATRLELYFWGVATTWSEMVMSVRREMLTASTQQTRKDLAIQSIVRLRARAPHTASIIEPLTERLAAERFRRTRGKEYDRVIGPYFDGMSVVLANVREFTKSGARVVMVVGDSAPYGVHIDTPMLLGELGQELDLELLESQLIRRRGTRWMSNGIRHQHPLAERLLVLRRPLR